MKTLQIIVPMAGRGQRFVDAGFTFPKPLIEIGPQAKPMIQVVVENLGLRGRWWFFCQEEHVKRYSLASLLRLVVSHYGGVEIVTTPQVTGGQADSIRLVLEEMAKRGDKAASDSRYQPEVVDIDSPVIVANSDQYLDGWHPGNFSEFIARHDPEAAVLTFHGTHPKWSFVEVEPEGNRVLRAAEKDPISTRAICGIFYFRTVGVLSRAIDAMMADPCNRVRGEWYLAPALNQIVEGQRPVIEFPIPSMLGLGTPEDYHRFVRLVEAGKVRI